MKKRILGILLFAVIVLLALSLAACKYSSDNNHEHKSGAAVTENYVTATCQSAGGYDLVVYCSECSDELERKHININKLDSHTATDWIIHKEPTCKDNGAKHKECTICKKVLETGVIDMLSMHTYGEAVTEDFTDSSCEAYGYYYSVVYCTVCDTKLSSQIKTVDMKPHTEIIDATVAPDCINTGLTEGKHCSVCEKVLVPQQPIAANGHKDENTDFVCDVCEEELCTNHTEAIIPGVKPTCTATGLTEGAKCAVCGDILVPQTVIDANGHTEVIDEAVDPDCINTGLTEGKHCFVCEEVLVPQTIINALGHTEVIDKGVAPNCLNTGLTEGKHCSVCEEVLVPQTTIGANGHSYEATFIPPTTTEDGYTNYICSVCGDSYKGTFVTPIDFEITADNRTLVGYTGSNGENLVIPAVFENDGTWYRVTSIGHEAFSWCSGLITITIPNSVTSIYGGAFNNCLRLTSVTIGNSVELIISSPFIGCRALTSIIVDESNSNYKSIDGNLYSKDGKTLMQYAIGKGATSFAIPDGVEIIAAYAFDSCASIESITIPNTTTNIGTRAFNECKKLASITIPGSVISIGDRAFSTCSALKSVIIENGIISIGGRSFSYCTSLENIYIPNSVTSIGIYAFDSCDSLKSVAIGNGVEIISQGAFSFCESLESVIMGNNVTRIQNGAFANCINLKNIDIPAGVTEIKSSAFYNCSSIISVTIPDGVEDIEMDTFSNCTSLTSITIGNGVTFIDGHAFYSCTSLRTINYRGTRDEWNAITKYANWDYNTGNYTIIYNYTGK